MTRNPQKRRYLECKISPFKARKLDVKITNFVFKISGTQFYAYLKTLGEDFIFVLGSVIIANFRASKFISHQYRAIVSLSYLNAIKSI